jgi:HEAT repeat protein
MFSEGNCSNADLHVRQVVTFKNSFHQSSAKFMAALSLTISVALSTVMLLAFESCRMSSSQERTSTVTALIAEPQVAPHRFVPGQQVTYRFSYSGASVSDFGELLAAKKPPSAAKAPKPSFGLAQNINTSVQGELIASVLDKRAEGVLIAYSLRNSRVSLDVNGQRAFADAERIKTDLAQDIFAVVSFQGKVISVRLDPAVSSLSRSFAHAMLGITQFVLPSAQEPDLGQWEIQEDDPNGQYIARYQGQPSTQSNDQPDLRAFRKTKLLYLQPLPKTKPGKFELKVMVKPETNLIARFDTSQDLLLSLNGTETQVVTIAGKKIARAEVSLQMDYVGMETLDVAELTRMREASAAREKVAVAVALSVTESEEVSEASVHRHTLGPATLESLLADITNTRDSKGEAYDETSLYLKFKALIYLHPESSASIGRILATADPESAIMRVLVGALSAIGHSEAQAALVVAIRAHPKDWPALSRLIPALGSAAWPTQLAEDTLRDLASDITNWDIASTAQLSLGVMAHNLEEISPERAASIVSWAIKQIESSNSNDTTRQFLLVLGNTGSIQALPTIFFFITNSSARLRAAAALALRFVKSNQADSLLIKTLTDDQDAAVRLDAARALGFRELGTKNFEAQKSAFLKDRAANVRLEVLKNLWRGYETFSEVRRLVRHSAVKDTSKEVRQAASKIIKSHNR